MQVDDIKNFAYAISSHLFRTIRRHLTNARLSIEKRTSVEVHLKPGRNIKSTIKIRCMARYLRFPSRLWQASFKDKLSQPPHIYRHNIYTQASVLK